ncbi:hypothetical protein DPMN_115120, partial [Dreissena polymorpha]
MDVYGRVIGTVWFRRLVIREARIRGYPDECGAAVKAHLEFCTSEPVKKMAVMMYVPVPTVIAEQNSRSDKELTEGATATFTRARFWCADPVKSVHPALIAIWPPNNADPATHMPSPRNQLGQSLTSKPAGPEMMGGHCHRTLAAGRMDACL